MAFRQSRRTARYESGPGDPEWEAQSKQRMREALEDQNFKTTLNEADIIVLRDRVMSTGGRLDNPVTCAEVAQKMLEEWEFSTALGALQKARDLTPQYETRMFAARGLIFKLADELDCDFSDARALAAVITQLGQAGKLPLSDAGRLEQQQAQAAARERSERTALIANITRGHDEFPFYSPAHGRAKNVDSASLQNETTERLREIDQAVAAYRGARDGVRVAPVVAPVDESIVATVAAPKKAIGYMGSDAKDEFLAHPNDPSREYTAREIKQNIRELLFINGQSRGQARVNAINRILAGRPYTG